jgi:hypothetical protein
MLRAASSPKSCDGFNIRGGSGIARAQGKFEAICPISSTRDRATGF